MSPELAAMNDRAAAAMPFARAAGLLEDLAGIRLTAKRVERAVEAGLVGSGLDVRDGHSHVAEASYQLRRLGLSGSVIAVAAGRVRLDTDRTGDQITPAWLA
jgi:hypothetical protein